MGEEKSDKQHKNNFDWLKEYAWQKGQSGNPKGRPKGKSLKEFTREFLANMSEEARLEFIKELPSDTIWKMAEGNPETKSDITSGGQPLQVIIPPQIAEAYNINAINEKTERSNTEQE